MKKKIVLIGLSLCFGLAMTSTAFAGDKKSDLGLKIGYLNVTGPNLSVVKVDGVSRCPPFMAIPVTAKIEHTVTNSAGVEKTVIVKPTETVSVNFDPEVEEAT